MEKKQYDLVVIGGGPGGYVAAIRAAQLKMKTAVVEANHLGGICLNWGCIPTKALLRSAEIYSYLQKAEEYGLTVSGASFDISKVVQRSRNVAKKLSIGVQHLLKKNKIDVVDGHGKLSGGHAGSHEITVEKNGKPQRGLVAKHVILATGARARELSHMETDGKLIWSYKDAMVPEVVPKSLLVIGSGAIGIEFASFFCNLGAEVTVVEMLDRILPTEDSEISAFAQEEFEKQGISFITGAKVSDLKKGAKTVTAQIESADKPRRITVDRVVMAIGIVGNTENLGLEQTKVKTENGHILVDQWLQTDEIGIYAIGDVVGAPWLAHKASHEAIICVDKIMKRQDVHPLEIKNIPSCTYCMPQIASVGLTEEAAKAEGRQISVGRFPFMGNGKAIALGEEEGLIKTIFDRETGELLGAHMVGAEVTELIHGYGLAKTLESTEKEIMATIFPHPTLSEMMHESVLDAYDQAIHI